MLYPLDDTIVAVASPPGGSARGIVRLSGPEVAGQVQEVFHPEQPIRLAEVTRPSAIPGTIRLGSSRPLPCDLYFWPTTRSYTGQPVAEIHTLGSLPLLEALVAALVAAGARLAQPGEFTLRAFLAGRIDLTQAEAVLGVIDAADPRQLDAALAQLAGGLAGPLRRLRDELVDLLAHLEAGFDFADEDISFIARHELETHLAVGAETVARLARQMASRTHSGALVRATLVGWPNTGKSSLFNALTGRGRALVSKHPGTTRDYLTAEMDLGGATCVLIDTAGMDPEPAGPDRDLDLAAQAAASQQSREAHVELFCLDSTRPASGPDQGRRPASDRPGAAGLGNQRGDGRGDIAAAGPAPRRGARRAGLGCRRGGRDGRPLPRVAPSGRQVPGACRPDRAQRRRRGAGGRRNPRRPGAAWKSGRGRLH
jgi:tRNA modification GTPase